MFRTCLLAVAMSMLLVTAACAQHSDNLLLNPGAEEGDGAPSGWTNEAGMGTWAEDEVHSGARSLKLHQDEPGGTRGWTSEMIPVPEPGRTQFMLAVWARLDQVSGRNGAFFGFYHTDENGRRIGQSGMYTIGGADGDVCTRDWREYVTLSNLTPEVKGVRVNVRLYGASGTVWFDDMRVEVFERGPITAPHPIRRGMRLDRAGACAIVSAEGAGEQARALQAALRKRGRELPVIPHDEVDLRTETRDLIILGDL
ncbi:MAG: hypothetical protein J7M38_02945, partial [Armatimonadetes bacterium]|nr:hypothetical protein [Armatimonadota bacterium]